MNARRKTDKIELIYKIAIAGMMGFVLYVVVPMESRVGKRIDEIKQIQKEQFKELYDDYTALKDEMNEIRLEGQKNIAMALDKVDEKIEKIYTWFRKKDEETPL